MKKIIIVSVFSLFVHSLSSSAQQFVARLTTTGNQPVTGTADFELKLGQNSVPVPTGTVTFKIDGVERVSTVKFTDSLGRSYDLKPVTASTSAEFKPECGERQGGSCFATTDKSIIFCICKPTGTTGKGRINYNTMRKPG